MRVKVSLYKTTGKYYGEEEFDLLDIPVYETPQEVKLLAAENRFKEFINPRDFILLVEVLDEGKVIFSHVILPDWVDEAIDAVINAVVKGRPVQVRVQHQDVDGYLILSVMKIRNFPPEADSPEEIDKLQCSVCGSIVNRETGKCQNSGCWSHMNSEELKEEPL
jgi:hypothetical protein